MQYRAKLIGAASLLLCVAFASQALTLGRIRGAALIGQPLNMVVPVQSSAGEDTSAACFDAEVFHADARQDPSRVKVVVEPTGQAGAINVRISSSAAVDEPVVTVYLRTICDQKTTRRYVLLADFPSDIGAAIASSQISSVPPVAAPVAPAAVESTTSSTSASAAATAPAPVAQPQSRVKPKPTAVKKAVKKPVKKAPAPQPSVVSPPVPTPPAEVRGQPRLTLDSPVLLADQMNALALTSPPEPSAEAQRDLLKIQSLESDVKALLALAAKNEASVLELRTRLQLAESERLPNWMVYALGALVLACLAVIALLLSRQRKVVSDDNNHWSASAATVVAPPMPDAHAAPLPIPVRVAMPGALNAQSTVSTQDPSPTASAPAPAHGVAQGAVTSVDVSLLEMSESNFDKLMQSGVAHSAVRKPHAPVKPTSATAASGPHHLNASSVFDVRQQAEFFVSLGQTDQAVRILEKHISDSNDPNPHAYLDLLAIFHSLSLKVDFRQFREDFNLLFNGRVPEFSAFKDEGQDLEAYPAVLDAISAVWPSTNVLGMIESLIFHDTLETGSQPFDLAAFRDLLLLHAVAQRILVASPGIAPSGSAAGVVTAAQANAKPYFADSGLGMPLPMPSPYATAAEVGEWRAVPDTTGTQEVDLDLNLGNADLDLNLDVSADPMARVAPTGALDMDLDLSLPSVDSADFEFPAVQAPTQGNLIDFDMSEPFLRPKSDDKTPS